MTAAMLFLRRLTFTKLREITLALESGKSTWLTHCDALLPLAYASVDGASQDDKVNLHATSDYRRGD
jgi:hypothetical protein